MNNKGMFYTNVDDYKTKEDMMNDFIALRMYDMSKDKEIERLHSIIKEAREYLPKLRRSTSYELDEKIDDLEEILDKVGETNDSTRNV